MAIKNVGQMTQALKSYDSKGWTSKTNKSREFGTPLEIGDSDFSKDMDVHKGEKVSQSFGDFLANSISKVNDLQNEANVAIESLASGKTKNIAETMLVVEQADIAFRTMNQIRQKVIDAYREVMKIQM